MIEKQSLSIQFLKNNLSLLREKKEHYFAPSFFEQLENTAFELLEAINQKNDSSAAIKQLATPSKISESFIDLCFNSIENEIKKLNLQSDQTEPQVSNELTSIAYDLFCLAVYIRFTLDPVGAGERQNIFVTPGDDEENFLDQERIN